MELNDAIKGRRSVRRFKPVPAMYTYRQAEDQINKPETARTAGCDRAAFNREYNGTFDGFAGDLVLEQTGR